MGGNALGVCGARWYGLHIHKIWHIIHIAHVRRRIRHVLAHIRDGGELDALQLSVTGEVPITIGVLTTLNLVGGFTGVVLTHEEGAITLKACAIRVHGTLGFGKVVTKRAAREERHERDNKSFASVRHGEHGGGGLEECERE